MILKITIAVLVALVILINVTYSYVAVNYQLYDESYTNVNDILESFTKGKKLSDQLGFEFKEIGEFLSKQPNIENSYIMAKYNGYAYYAHSKFVYTTFSDETTNSLKEFITRENWSKFDVIHSNLHSIPIDRYNIFKPMPDYLIFEKSAIHDVGDLTYSKYQKMLSNIENSEKFEIIYQSNKTNTTVYKINYEK